MKSNQKVGVEILPRRKTWFDQAKAGAKVPAFFLPNLKKFGSKVRTLNKDSSTLAIVFNTRLNIFTTLIIDSKTFGKLLKTFNKASVTLGKDS
jgi:hypothetical protein